MTSLSLVVEALLGVVAVCHLVLKVSETRIIRSNANAWPAAILILMFAVETPRAMETPRQGASVSSMNQSVILTPRSGIQSRWPYYDIRRTYWIICRTQQEAYSLTCLHHSQKEPSWLPTFDPKLYSRFCLLLQSRGYQKANQRPVTWLLKVSLQRSNNS